MARSLARGSGCHPATVWMFNPQAAVLLLFGEHVLKALKDNENGFAFKFLERLHEALHVDGAKLMERNETAGP